MLISNNIFISESDITKVNNDLLTFLNEYISRYIALDYSVKFIKYTDLSSNELVEASSIYTSVYSETDKFYNNYDYKNFPPNKELETLIKVDDKKQIIYLSDFVEIPVDIDLHFKMYFYYHLVYNYLTHLIEIQLIGIKFYANEINQQMVEDNEIYISLDLGDLSDTVGIYVISDVFKMLDNIIFLDINMNLITYRLCLCSTHKELLIGYK